MKLVYVAGKYRDDEPYKVYQNIERAWLMGLQVAKLGAYPVIPHKCTEHMEGIQGGEFFIQGTLEMMRRCDAVMIVGQGWETSVGTIGEIKEASRLGIPVFYKLSGLQKWCVKQKALEDAEPKSEDEI